MEVPSAQGWSVNGKEIVKKKKMDVTKKTEVTDGIKGEDCCMRDAVSVRRNESVHMRLIKCTVYWSVNEKYKQCTH